MIEAVILVIVGLAGGLAVGTGFIAFLAVLGIIPRLTQLSKTHQYIIFYEQAIITGAVSACWIELRNLHAEWSEWLLVPLGLFSGVFIGMLAAALTEVLNVPPILAKRLGIDNKLIILLMGIVLGKVCGALFHWLYMVKINM